MPAKIRFPKRVHSPCQSSESNSESNNDENDKTYKSQISEIDLNQNEDGNCITSCRAINDKTDKYVFSNVDIIGIQDIVSANLNKTIANKSLESIQNAKKMKVNSKNDKELEQNIPVTQDSSELSEMKVLVEKLSRNYDEMKVKYENVEKSNEELKRSLHAREIVAGN